MVNNCRYNIIEKALYDGPSANLRPLFIVIGQKYLF